jgi:hypothetical protein
MNPLQNPNEPLPLSNGENRKIYHAGQKNVTNGSINGLVPSSIDLIENIAILSTFKVVGSFLT